MSHQYGYAFELYNGQQILFAHEMYILATDINKASENIKLAFPSFVQANIRKISDDPMTKEDLQNWIKEHMKK